MIFALIRIDKAEEMLYRTKDDGDNLSTRMEWPEVESVARRPQAVAPKPLPEHATPEGTMP